MIEQLSSLSRFTASMCLLRPGRRDVMTGFGVAWLALALLVAHAPFLRAVAAELAYTPIAVPLPPGSKPLLNDKWQVLTVVTGTVYATPSRPGWERMKPFFNSQGPRMLFRIA